MFRMLFTLVAALVLCCSCKSPVDQRGKSCDGCREKTSTPRTGSAQKTGPQPQDIDSRISEIEKRLDYLTSELATQRGDLDRVRENIGSETEAAKK
jgi:hypothetical protein